MDIDAKNHGKLNDVVLHDLKTTETEAIDLQDKETPETVFEEAINEIVTCSHKVALELFLGSSWSKTIYPWLQAASTTDRNRVISHLRPILKDRVPRVPEEWSGSYGSLARHARWLRLAYRLPCVEEPRPEAVLRVWDSRVSLDEGRLAVARLVSWVDGDPSDYEVECLAEALDAAGVPARKGTFLEENLDYVHMRIMIKEFLGKPCRWYGYEDFLHKFSYVSLKRRITAFQGGISRPGDVYCYWTTRVGEYEANGMCHLLGLVEPGAVLSDTEARRQLSLVLRRTMNK